MVGVCESDLRRKHEGTALGGAISGQLKILELSKPISRGLTLFDTVDSTSCHTKASAAYSSSWK